LLLSPGVKQQNTSFGAFGKQQKESEGKCFLPFFALFLIKNYTSCFSHLLDYRGWEMWGSVMKKGVFRFTKGKLDEKYVTFSKLDWYFEQYFNQKIFKKKLSSTEEKLSLKKINARERKVEGKQEIKEEEGGEWRISSRLIRP
jgi:hypothetical protein